MSDIIFLLTCPFSMSDIIGFLMCPLPRYYITDDIATWWLNLLARLAVIDFLHINISILVIRLRVTCVVLPPCKFVWLCVSSARAHTFNLAAPAMRPWFCFRELRKGWVYVRWAIDLVGWSLDVSCLSTCLLRGCVRAQDCRDLLYQKKVIIEATFGSWFSIWGASEHPHSCGNSGAVDVNLL